MLRRSLMAMLVGFGLASTPAAAHGAVPLNGGFHDFTVQVGNSGVPSFSTDRADTPARFEPLNAIAQSARAVVVNQHRLDDIAKLSVLPGSVR